MQLELSLEKMAENVDLSQSEHVVNNEEEEPSDETDQDQAQMLMSSDTMMEIMRAKKNQKTQFESYWEKDENDIENWTKVMAYLL